MNKPDTDAIGLALTDSKAVFERLKHGKPDGHIYHLLFENCDKALSKLQSQPAPVADGMPEEIFCFPLGNAFTAEHGVGGDIGFAYESNHKGTTRYVRADLANDGAFSVVLDALEIMYEGYENGTPCYDIADDPECPGAFIGNAFELDADQEKTIIDLLNKHRPRPPADLTQRGGV